MACVQDVTPGMFLPTVQFATAALSSSAASAGQLSGGAIVVMNNSGGTPGTYTTRTAAQMLADSGLVKGNRYLLLLVNGQATGTLTLAGGTGVTVSGTATVAANTARLFTVDVTNTTPGSEAITITNVMSFTGTAFAFGA